MTAPGNTIVNSSLSRSASVLDTRNAMRFAAFVKIAAAGLADHGTEKGISEESPALVQDRRYCFFSKPVISSVERVNEKMALSENPTDRPF